MVIGTAGAFFTKNAVQNPPPEWNELFFYEYGYAKVTAISPSELKWEWIMSESDEVVDTLIITQSSRASSSSSNGSLSPGTQAGVTIGALIGLSLILWALYVLVFKTPKSYSLNSQSVNIQLPSLSLIRNGEGSDEV